MATQVEVPRLGESVTQATLVHWHKKDGENVAADEPLCELETDKANVDLPSPASGIVRHVKDEGETVAVGEVIARIDEGSAPATPKRSAAKTPVPVAAAAAASPATVAPSAAAAPASHEPSQTEIPSPAASSSAPTSNADIADTPLAGAAAPTPADDMSPAVRRLVDEHNLDVSAVRGTGPGGRVTKEDVLNYLDEQQEVDDEKAIARPTRATAPSPAAPPTVGMDFDAQGTRRVPMSKLRKRIAERLVSAQHTAAILTTFNEIDMHGVLELRSKYKERFAEVHNVGLGLMSFFVRGCVLALREFPRINAFLDGDDVVYHQFVHMGIAVSTDRGLAVPVLRHVENMSFARIEADIKRLATATRDGKLSLEELSGGTFTITNGGVFGSLLSTPILNPPQSGILGMHTIQKRPVVVDDKIEIRPMMLRRPELRPPPGRRPRIRQLPRPPQATRRRSGPADAGDLIPRQLLYLW